MYISRETVKITKVFIKEIPKVKESLLNKSFGIQNVAVFGLALKELIVMEMGTALAKLGIVARSALNAVVDILNQMEGVTVRFNCIYTFYRFKLPAFFKYFRNIEIIDCLLNAVKIL